MVKFFSNLPDSDHVPYTFITDEPHVRDIVRYMRKDDLMLWGGIAAGFPALHFAWERAYPSFHPKVMPRVMAIQIPFFATVGFFFAAQRSLFRFWGWRENDIEVARWNAEASARPAPVKKGWQDNDW
ncbi:hypothetical protein SpCBS45565_g01955 [Spizellomyces sp. 'palustris']|nr:hypothetical protein SpCBS45565_g01955 [Spizellomyces sp. 'palustris']